MPNSGRPKNRACRPDAAAARRIVVKLQCSGHVPGVIPQKGRRGTAGKDHIPVCLAAGAEACMKVGFTSSEAMSTRMSGGSRWFKAGAQASAGMGLSVWKFATWPNAWTPASVLPEEIRPDVLLRELLDGGFQGILDGRTAAPLLGLPAVIVRAVVFRMVDSS